MFCRSCGNNVDEKAVACMKCGLAPHDGNKFCQECGKETADKAIVCVSCGVSLEKKSTPAATGGSVAGADKKVTAGVCGLLLGALGVHKFVLGYNTEGLIMLLVTLLTFGFGGIIMGPIGLIEGIIYITKSDEDFVNTYVKNKKGWF